MDNELGVFPIFAENDLSKVLRILGLMFLRQEKTSKDSKQRFPFNVYRMIFFFLHNGMFTTTFHSSERGRFVNLAFPNKKTFAQKSKL